MADKIEMGNVVIPPHHQSAPKQHWADKEIQAAAAEIDAGRWMPDVDPERDDAMRGLGIALGLGDDAVAHGMKPALEDFRHTQNLDTIGRHPRVMEAIEKMRQETYQIGDHGKLLEHTFAMRELAAAAEQTDKWDGQGRWEGKEAEEMRVGKILSPQQFHEQLLKVKGTEHIKIGDYVVRTSAAAKSGRVGLFVRNPEYKGGQIITGQSKQEMAADLRLKGMHHLNRGKQLRRLQLESEASKEINLAGDMAQEAMRLLGEAAEEDLNRPKEWIRVGVLQWPANTEWMIMDFTEFGAVRKPRFLGWRTALLTMIRAGVLTEKQAHKAFPVGSGPAAAWYLEQLAMMRAETGAVQ